MNATKTIPKKSLLDWYFLDGLDPNIKFKLHAENRPSFVIIFNFMIVQK